VPKTRSSPDDQIGSHLALITDFKTNTQPPFGSAGTMHLPANPRESPQMKSKPGVFFLDGEDMGDRFSG
jgi:hypothetical protein